MYRGIGHCVQFREGGRNNLSNNCRELGIASDDQLLETIVFGAVNL